jgi:geranylgeranyl diphosphate synthase type I
VTHAGEILSALDRELKNRTASTHAEFSEFFGMFHYHLGWTDSHGNPVIADMGKRIRPLVCVWSCEAVGGNWQDALSAAASIELIHNFSLIHDDIQDKSESRRGRATVWNVWGVAQAINAGDAMFVLAQQAMDDLPAQLSLERYVAIQRTFHSAILRLTQGQYLDLAYERADQVTMEQYLQMVGGKTAALLAAASEIGARIGTTDSHLSHAFATYGEQLGIAFQIADDVLGIWGDPELTGKSARTDLMSRKKSYPVLYAMQGKMGGDLRALYLEKEWTDDQFGRVEEILKETDARGFARAQAREYAARAEKAIDTLGLDNDAIISLRNLATQVTQRDK